MQQQHKQLPQTQDWPVRLAERMGSKEWIGRDPVLESLTPERAVEFLLAQQQEDRPLVTKYWQFQLLIKPTVLLFAYAVILLVMKHFRINTNVATGLFLGQFVWSFFTESPFAPRKPLAAQRRQQRLNLLLAEYLPQCASAELTPDLLAARAHSALSQRPPLDRALIRNLTRMSGEEVFALPFELRADLVRLAEQRETPLNLAIVILLALTSARDGNVQPVLRRLSRDARSVRLREVAAECLREFSSTP